VNWSSKVTCLTAFEKISLMIVSTKVACLPALGNATNRVAMQPRWQNVIEQGNKSHSDATSVGKKCNRTGNKSHSDATSVGKNVIEQRNKSRSDATSVEKKNNGINI
jgi:hypothetical protein